MEKYESECVGCLTHCLGDACPYRNVKIIYCDKCGKEIEDDVYEVDGEDLCEDCLKEMYRKEV